MRTRRDAFGRGWAYSRRETCAAERSAARERVQGVAAGKRVPGGPTREQRPDDAFLVAAHEHVGHPVSIEHLEALRVPRSRREEGARVAKALALVGDQRVLVEHGDDLGAE